MGASGRQLELLPLRRQTARQRKELIRERLNGLQYRQAARAQRRHQLNERRKARLAGDIEREQRQMTIEDALSQPPSSPSRSADLDQPVTTLPLFPDIFD